MSLACLSSPLGSRLGSWFRCLPLARLGSAGVGIALLASTLSAQPSVTIITHGFQASGSFPTWPAIYGEAAVDRAGGGTVLEYDPSDGSWILRTGTGDPSQPIALTINWAEDSAYVPGVTDDRTGTAPCAAAAVYAALRSSPLPAGLSTTTALTDAMGAARPIHLIGHSRGASVQSELALLLLTDGIAIDQVTTLDPHPVIELLDPTPVVWEGTDWSDNYYRQDGCDIDMGCLGFDFDGQPIPGAADEDLGFLDALGPFDNRFSVCTLEHITLKTWYFGTIDLTGTSDGDCTIVRPDWYAAGGAGEGYYYSLAGGGSADRPCGPTGGCPDAGRTPLVPVTRIANGDFQFGSNQEAGWLWHGGGGSADIVASGGETFLRFDPGSETRVSNRFFVPATAGALELDYRVIQPDVDLDDELVVSLIGPTGDFEVARIDLFPSPTDWQRDQLFPFPAGLVRDASYRLDLRMASTGAVLASAGIDNLELVDGPAVTLFRRGDCNQDGASDIADAVALLETLFAGGASPSCDDACDHNDDGALNIADAVALLTALFGGGPGLPAPTGCGEDPTPDALDCAAAPGC